MCGLCVVVNVLHNQKVEPIEDVSRLRLIDPRVSRVRADDPQPFDFASQNSLEDFVVSPARFARDEVLINAEDACDFLSVLIVSEIVAAQQICRVAEKPRAHRVALPGDRVRTGPWPPNVAGHQREIDDRLSCPDSLVALVDSHRPPERNAFALVNQPRETLDLCRGEAGL